MFCPVCHNINEDTASFCVTCGSVLEGRSTDLVTITDHASPTADVSAFIDTALIPKDGIAIYIAGAPKPFYLSIDKGLILGRQVGLTADTVLDLTSLAAFNMGVSRRHAMIRRAGSDFEVLDLASRNGTWLNTKQLIPHQPYLLPSGSQLRLGRMQLFIVHRIMNGAARK